MPVRNLILTTGRNAIDVAVVSNTAQRIRSKQVRQKESDYSNDRSTDTQSKNVCRSAEPGKKIFGNISIFHLT